MIRIIINISEHSCISMFLMTLSPNISCFLHCLRPSYFFLSNQLSLKQSQIWIWNLALHCICRMQPFGFKTSRKLLVQTWSKKQQSTDSILCSASQQCLGLRHIFSYNMTSWEHSQSVMKAVRFSVHKSQLCSRHLHFKNVIQQPIWKTECFKTTHAFYGMTIGIDLMTEP